MGFFDVKTLSLVALITSLLLPLVLITSAQFTSTHTPAARSWIQGALAYALGFFLLALRGNIPDWLSFFVGNVLIVGGFVELAFGTRVYLRGATKRRGAFLLTVGNAIAMFWCVVIRPDPSQRVFIASIFLLPVCGWMCIEFFTAAKRLGQFIDRGASAEKRLLQGLGAMFFLSGLSFAWRAQAFWNTSGEIDAATLGGRTWGASFLVGVLLNIVLSICLPLLISRRNQRELAQSQALLRETERLADVGSFLYEPHSQRMTPNSLMARWLGRAVGASLRLPTFLEAFESPHREQLARNIDAIASGSQTQWSGECHMRGEDGHAPRWLSVHCGEMDSASGQRFVILSARNVTEFKVATESAIAARNEANRANAAKSAFLANMSHEIRTPMNGVLGLTRLCLDGDLPPRERTLIEKCHISAQTLLGVLNDILDFSKIEAGKLVVESEAFDLERTVNNARHLFEQMAGGKGLRFSVSLAPDVPRCLIGDALRLSQILNNLLSNAVKFTEQGEIRLDIHCQTAEGAQVVLVFAVRDSGIGMNAQQVDRLFQAFTQADASTTRRYGGTGLGLVISQRLAELMGGTLAVQSVPAQGSTFTATLPFGVGYAAGSASEPARALPKHRLQGIRVLLVEDNPTNVLVATLSLQAQGAMVMHRADGKQAVDFVRDNASEIDVVLMDIQMPVMDGYTATRHIREQLGLTHLPIIAMTANVMESDREASRAAGMRAHVGKPFDMDRLIATILEATGTAGATADTPPVAAPAPKDEAVAPTEAPVALDEALQRMGDDADLMQQATQSFADGLEDMFASLRVQQEDLKAARATLHTLKGLAATLGLNAAAAQAREFEAQVKAGDALNAVQIDALEQLVTSSLHALQDQLQARLPAPAEPATGVGTPAQAQAVVHQLATLLAQADLTALEWFAQHRELLQSQLGDAFDGLETALQALDLEAALAQCQRTLHTK